MKVQVTVTVILVMLGTLIWQRNLAPGQKKAVSEGLVSYWSFDEETIEGKTVKDVLGVERWQN